MSVAGRRDGRGSRSAPTTSAAFRRSWTSAADGARCCRHPPGPPGLRGVLFDLPATADEAKGHRARRGSAEPGNASVATSSPPCGRQLPHSLGGPQRLERREERRDPEELPARSRPRGRLLLLERMLEPAKPAPASSFMDLQMLVIGGGTGRSAEEYRRLLSAAGLELARRASEDRRSTTRRAN